MKVELIKDVKLDHSTKVKDAGTVMEVTNELGNQLIKEGAAKQYNESLARKAKKKAFSLLKKKDDSTAEAVHKDK